MLDIFEHDIWGWKNENGKLICQKKEAAAKKYYSWKTFGIIKKAKKNIFAFHDYSTLFCF